MTLACTGIGIGVAQSIAIGQAHILQQGLIEASKRSILECDIDAEISRFKHALAAAEQHLRAVRTHIPSSTPDDIIAFIDTHLLMLKDSALTKAPLDLIRNDCYAAEWALQVQRNTLVKIFDEMEDPYLRTRKDDVDHVVNQIQKVLLHGEPEDPIAKPDDLAGKIILAHDLTPADTLLMRQQGIAAFVTEFGSPMSHTAILARSLGIPAVIGVRNATQLLKHGELIVIDADQGVVLADTNSTILNFYRNRIEEHKQHAVQLRTLVDQPSVTQDGKTISLMANIELPEDIQSAKENGADGVGLYRTEFLYMNRASIPDEEEQLEAYLKVVKGLENIPITIRTLDLGTDKQIGSQSMTSYQASCNPALGLRAVRLCLKEPQLFRPQLRAIFRAGAEGPVRLMIPMLSSLGELSEVFSLIEEIKEELRKEGLAFDPNIPIGGMIEIPAAALSADAFARKLDFLSIGTNDLVQYTLAVDRIDDQVNYLFDPLHPAVLRLIKMTLDAAQTHNIPVSMCGEMAGDARYTQLLIGMGLTEFSMQPGALLEIKRLLRGTHVEQLKRQTDELFTNQDENLIEQLLELNNPPTRH